MAGDDLKEYFDNARFKDGYARCTKLLKKSPNDPYLLVCKIRFLSALDRHNEAQPILKSFVEGKTSVSDVRALTALDSYIADPFADTHPPVLTLGPEANTLWNNATSGVPKDKAIALHNTRFDLAAKAGRWIDAGYVSNNRRASGISQDEADDGQALAAWRKIEPQRMQLRALQAAVYQAVSESPSAQETVRRINQQLAIRTLEQIPNLAGSEADLALYCQLSRRQSQYEKIVQVFAKFSPEKSLSWDNFRHKRDAYVELKDWKNVRACTEDMLRSTTSPSDETSGRELAKLQKT